jgi:CRISPR-associated protein Cas5d
MKVERVSYDVITPSAARAVFDSILWKPAIRWRIRQVDVLSPVRWISVKRNEVGAVASTRNALTAMSEGSGMLALYVEEERQQRAGLFLRDVAYRLYADMELVTDEARSNPGKYVSMFTRRAAAGQCVNQPYLGCREFAARFRLIDAVAEAANGRQVAPAERAVPLEWNADLGWMLFDMDFDAAGGPRPQFFRARIDQGVMQVRGVEVHG